MGTIYRHTGFLSGLIGDTVKGVEGWLVSGYGINTTEVLPTSLDFPNTLLTPER